MQCVQYILYTVQLFFDAFFICCHKFELFKCLISVHIKRKDDTDQGEQM